MFEESTNTDLGRALASDDCTPRYKQTIEELTGRSIDRLYILGGLFIIVVLFMP